MELKKLGAKSSNNGNQESMTWGDQGLVPDGCAPEPGLLENLCVVGGHRSDWHAFKLYIGVAQVVGLVVVVGVMVSVWRFGGCSLRFVMRCVQGDNSTCSKPPVDF